MVGAKWLFLIYFGYRAVGYHSPEIFKMSGSGATYYNEELKYLYRLLKNLPNVILKAMPTTSQITSLIRKRQKTSAAPKVWSAKLSSLHLAGETITVSFKPRGSPLKEVVTTQ
jgi:hypothetical protein